MLKAAKNVGGNNFLLSLLEAMKTKKPHALCEKSSQIASNNTIIKWNKVVFKDKVDLLQSILDQHKTSQNQSLNILDELNEKKRKNIINMVRALTPIEFFVIPQNPNDGAGFSFKIFETISESEVTLNPIFSAMFFCSVDFTKKALKHTL